MLPDPARETSHRPQIRGHRAALDPADHRLTDPCTRGEPTLGQPRSSASVAHLLTESLDDVGADHGFSIGRTRYCAVIARSTRRLLGCAT